MIVVILPGHVYGQPRQDHFGARQPHQPHRLTQSPPVIPRLQRLQHILSRSVGPPQEPHVQYAEGGQRLARFCDPDGAQRGRLRVPLGIAAAIARCAENRRDALVLVVNGTGEVAGDKGFVVGMSNNQENVRLEPLVGRRIRRGILDLRVTARWCCARARRRQAAGRQESSHYSGDQERCGPGIPPKPAKKPDQGKPPFCGYTRRLPHCFPATG